MQISCRFLVGYPSIRLEGLSKTANYLWNFTLSPLCSSDICFPFFARRGLLATDVSKRRFEIFIFLGRLKPWRWDCWAVRKQTNQAVQQLWRAHQSAGMIGDLLTVISTWCLWSTKRSKVVPRNFFFLGGEGSTKSVEDRRHRERGSGGGSP